MNRFACAVAILLLAASAISPSASAQSPPELFQKAKQQVKLGAWEDARKTLELLDAESLRPGNEAERKKLEPSLLFYRGVCEAALGRDADARSDFSRFLAFVPNASIDPAAFPKKAVALFEEVKKGGASRTAGGAGDATLMAAYAKFQSEPPPPNAAGDAWANGPVRYLMSSDEKDQWNRLSDEAARAEFVTTFWVGRDGTPGTAPNEFRDEFERRVAFADKFLGHEEKRGSLTDRGMVFVLLGPPNFIGRQSISPENDASDIRPNSPSKVLDTQSNFMESWHYRRELLPPGTPFLQVDFDFITRRGYGVNVLQRESKGFATLHAAKRPRRSG